MVKNALQSAIKYVLSLITYSNIGSREFFFLEFNRQ